MSNYQSGHDAEKVVADYLKKLGYKIVDINWRTKVCEIDIVADKDGCMYFVEVKSRASLSQGDGFSYITPKKLQSMHRAAEVWVSQQHYSGEYVLAAASIVDGEIEFIDNIY